MYVCEHMHGFKNTLCSVCRSVRATLADGFLEAYEHHWYSHEYILCSMDMNSVWVCACVYICVGVGVFVFIVDAKPSNYMKY